MFRKVRNKKTTIAGIMAILGAIVQAYNQGAADEGTLTQIALGLGLIMSGDGGI